MKYSRSMHRTVSNPKMEKIEIGNFIFNLSLLCIIVMETFSAVEFFLNQGFQRAFKEFLK